jgi:hypothetical protein
LAKTPGLIFKGELLLLGGVEISSTGVGARIYKGRIHGKIPLRRLPPKKPVS